MCSDILKRHIAKCRAASGSEHILIEPETSNAPPRRACDRCARLKVRCDFVQPCSRCSRHQNECTYHRLSSNKPNGSSDERRASQVSVNGNGTTQVSSQPPAESTSLNGIGNINQSTNSFSGFPTPFSLGQTQTVTSPPRMLPAPLTSPSLGIYNLQHSSPQDRLNHISPSNQNSQTSSGPSPFNTFPNIPTPNPSLMDITSSSTSHQPVFSQSMDVNNPTGDVDVMFASTDPSDMIFNSNFSADDTFYSWKPFEYQMNNDASLDFLFGPDLGFFDIGFSPNDPQLGETYVPPTLNNNHNMYPPGDESEKEKEPVPDEGLVATFDPGTGDGEDHVAHSHPPSRAGPRPTAEHHSDYLQLIQVDPLQARCDQLAIAVCGSLENLSSQDSWIQEFFTTENIKNNLFLWSKRYAQHVPVIHLPTFSILTAPDALLFILCVIGKAYSRPGIDTERLQWCVDVFTRLSAMERVNGELDFKNLEANFILVVLCTWHGNKPQREHAKRLFKEVCDTAKRHGYNKVQPAKETDGSDEAKWKAWIDQETRIRYFTFPVTYLTQIYDERVSDGRRICGLFQ
jgi:Fungal Zn(2)-Cys(6) binuclear cluster domain